MTKPQAQQGAALALLILFGVILWRTHPLPFLRAPGAAGSPAPAAPPIPQEPALAKEPVSPAPAVTEAQPTPARSPFDLPAALKQILQEKEALRAQQRPSSGQNQPPPVRIDPPNLHLEGLFWGIPRPQAIINRRIVSVGDEIDGTRITAITPEGVALNFQGQEWTLPRPAGIPSSNSGSSSGNAWSSSQRSPEPYRP